MAHFMGFWLHFFLEMNIGAAKHTISSTKRDCALPGEYSPAEARIVLDPSSLRGSIARQKVVGWRPMQECSVASCEPQPGPAPREIDLMPSIFNALRAAACTLTLGLPLFIGGCNQGDVGAPCNHGTVDPPSTKLVTFPALSCDDLLCVYGEEKTLPPDKCAQDSDCNPVGSDKIFECVIPSDESQGDCALSLDYVLRRSMCSKRCTKDEDCKNTTATNRPVAKETACQTGFACARIQQLGEFCCEKLCVCNDDLPDTSELDLNCETGNQPGCEDYIPS